MDTDSRPAAELAIPLLVACERVAGCAQLGAVTDRAFVAYATPVLLASEQYFLCWGAALSRWRLGGSAFDRGECLDAAVRLQALCDLVGWPSEVTIQNPAALSRTAAVLRVCVESSPMGQLRGEAAVAFARLAR